MGFKEFYDYLGRISDEYGKEEHLLYSMIGNDEYVDQHKSSMLTNRTDTIFKDNGLGMVDYEYVCNKLIQVATEIFTACELSPDAIENLYHDPVKIEIVPYKYLAVKLPDDYDRSEFE